MYCADGHEESTVLIDSRCVGKYLASKQRYSCIEELPHDAVARKYESGSSQTVHCSSAHVPLNLGKLPFLQLANRSSLKQQQQ